MEIEYVDELAELYEPEEWLYQSAEKHKASFVSLADDLTRSYEKVNAMQEMAAKKLSVVMEAAIASGMDSLSMYQNTLVATREGVNKVIERLTERLEEIYAHDRATQVKNFYKVLKETLETGL